MGEDKTRRVRLFRFRKFGSRARDGAGRVTLGLTGSMSSEFGLGQGESSGWDRESAV